MHSTVSDAGAGRRRRAFSSSISFAVKVGFSDMRGFLPGATIANGQLCGRAGYFRPYVGGINWLNPDVWGAVYYDDEFRGKRSTTFCHRYNTESRDVRLPGALRDHNAPQVQVQGVRVAETLAKSLVRLLHKAGSMPSRA
jgi:hypothetical protein